MLTITPEAMQVIQRVTDHPTLARTSGVRIARRSDRSAPLEVCAVDGPGSGDRVVERSGARLYLGPDVPARLSGRALDAEVDPDGQVQFVLRQAS